VVHGEAWGNLYLTEKDHGEFTEDDEEAVRVLADWAAIAIANARLYRNVRQRNEELQRAIRGLETTTEIGRALGGVTDLDRVLELVVKRSRALIDARAMQLTLLDGDELVVAAVAGQGVQDARGKRLAVADSVVSTMRGSGRAQRLSTLPENSFAHRELGAHTALVAPMMFRNRSIGFLTAFDRMGGDESFTEEDERLLQAFAASAASAVATAQTATDEALRRSMHASEEERRRWARELHDQTLQELAALKVMLAGGRSSGDPARLNTAVDQAVELITDGIANLRTLITELRPAALDELGTAAALEALKTRVEAQSSLNVELDVRLAYEDGRSECRHVPELEAAIYRLVQEALTNVVKHAGAGRALVRIADDEDDEWVSVEIRDDGRGFDPADVDAGFGLIGMRERVALVHGTLDVRSQRENGTAIVARIPIRRRERSAGEPASVGRAA
jgi:signal transduction histidine kinase